MPGSLREDSFEAVVLPHLGAAYNLARWLMRDEVAEVQSYGTVLGAPELSQFNDVAAGVVNLRFARGPIGHVESFPEAIYGYDLRTEVVGTTSTRMGGDMPQTRQRALRRGGAADRQPPSVRSLAADVDEVPQRGGLGRVRAAIVVEGYEGGVPAGRAAGEGPAEAQPQRVAAQRTEWLIGGRLRGDCVWFHGSGRLTERYSTLL